MHTMHAHPSPRIKYPRTHASGFSSVHLALLLTMQIEFDGPPFSCHHSNTYRIGSFLQH